MLVLARRLGEKIYVGNDVVVTVVQVQHGRVRLGFDCPSQIPIHREEVYWRIQAEQEEAQRLPADRCECSAEFI
jgi:carbon storage regulator